LFGGLGWLFTTPRAWPSASVPCVLFVGLGGGLAALSIAYVPDWIDQGIGPTTSALGGFGTAVLKVLATAAAVVVSTLFAFALAQPLSGPALEQLVRLQERSLGAPERPPTPFLVDIGRSLKSMLVGYGIGIPIAIALLIVSVVAPFASVVTVPLKFLVAAFTIGWDLCDYPLSVRGMRVRERLAIIGRYKSAVFGFSAGLALAALVPCLLFLLLPAGVAGATRLLFAIELHERTATMRG
jgi:CysZ protein